MEFEEEKKVQNLILGGPTTPTYSNVYYKHHIERLTFVFSPKHKKGLIGKTILVKSKFTI